MRGVSLVLGLAFVACGGSEDGEPEDAAEVGSAGDAGAGGGPGPLPEPAPEPGPPPEPEPLPAEPSPAPEPSVDPEPEPSGVPCEKQEDCAVDVPCQVGFCSPVSGTCQIAPDPACPQNHPCQVSEEPESNDPDLTSCVCAANPFCCTLAWDEPCVETAEEDCGLHCGCDHPGADLACTVSEDCEKCGPPSTCGGTWSCVKGVCTNAGKVVCPDDDPGDCLVPACEEPSGACKPSPKASLCADGEPCTKDACDAVTGLCEHAKILGCTDEPHPCLAGASPGSGEPAVDACVCAFQPECCDVAWSAACVTTAGLKCEVACDCAAAGGADLACADDDDCLYCETDPCQGLWTCERGTCTPGSPVVCDPTDDQGCVVNHCVPETAACELAPHDAACDDGDFCTLDSCGIATADCSHEPVPGCGETHPCTASELPASNDPAVNACVCALDPGCCETGWTGICAALAESACGVPCDCLAAPPACASAADCAFCDDGDLCNGAFECSGEGACVPVAPVECDPSGDTPCAHDTCDPATGTCSLVPEDALCDDGEPCTLDACSGPGSTCEHVALSNCGDSPPYPCKGVSVPAVAGCPTVPYPEGCCDPWGRLVWCEDGDTFCIDCQLTSPPTCGWQAKSGFYDCEQEGADPAGVFPEVCPAYAP